MVAMDYRSVEYLLAGAILLGRLADIGSTWLVSPKLQLEANPLVRRLRWPFAWMTLLTCLIPFWYAPMGLVVAIVSFLVAAQNLSHAWLVRTLGEDRMRDLQMEAVRRSSLPAALGFTWLASAPLFACAGLVAQFGGDPNKGWGFWIAFGIGLYAFALAFHTSRYFVRLFRGAHSGA
jgi:hypothetical protein